MRILSIAAAAAALGASALTIAHNSLPGGPSLRGDITRSQATEVAEQHFAKVDLDRDRRVTRPELLAARARMQERFNRFSPEARAEMRQRMQDRLSKLPPARRAQIEQHRAEMRENNRTGAFAAKLLGPDGVLTKAELHDHVARLFARVDTNRDGIVTSAERRQFGRNGGAAF